MAAQDSTPLVGVIMGSDSDLPTMQAAIDDVNASLMRIASSVSSLVPDAQFGVGHYDDFPVEPYGNTRDGFPVYYTDFFGLPITCSSSSVCRAQASATSTCHPTLRLCVEPCTSTSTCTAPTIADTVVAVASLHASAGEVTRCAPQTLGRSS